MRLLLFLLATATAHAGYATPALSVVWVEHAPTAAAVVHGMSRGCMACPRPSYDEVQLDQYTWASTRGEAGKSANPPSAMDRRRVRAALPAVHQLWWDYTLKTDGERDALIDAFRRAPPW